MPEATACPPSVVADTIMRTIELRMTITDAAIDEDATTIFCTPVARNPRCPDCGCQGRYRDTATRLFISEATVRNHFTSILGKLDVSNKFELVVYAFRHGLVMKAREPPRFSRGRLPSKSESR